MPVKLKIQQNILKIPFLKRFTHSPQNPVQQISFLIKYCFHWTSFTQISGEKKCYISYLYNYKY